MKCLIQPRPYELLLLLKLVTNFPKYKEAPNKNDITYKDAVKYFKQRT